MNPTVSQLLGQGLVMTVIGMGLVFAALGLLWALIRLIGVVFASPDDQAAEPVVVPFQATATVARAEAGEGPSEAALLTEERARVAAVVAAALLSNALPLLFEVPSGPAFEHGRTAPSWVTANRARTLHPWRPPRADEG